MSNTGGGPGFQDAIYVQKKPFARIKPLTAVDKNGLVTLVLDTSSATFVFPGPDATDILTTTPPSL